MLSDTAIKNAKPKAKPYKMTDALGLHVLIQPNGSKYFRLKYRYDGKEKTLALGVYPDTSLKQARDKQSTARKQLAEGIDPGVHKKAVKEARVESAANSFEFISREWGSKKLPSWSEPKHPTKRMLERHIFPWLGSKPITDITPPDVLKCLRRIEDNGFTDQSHRVLQVCGQVFRYAVATTRVTSDITRDLKGALIVAEGKHMAAITEPKEVGELLRSIDRCNGSLPVVSALKLAPLVFVRPGELRAAEWKDIDFDAAEWRYQVTKTDAAHIVPLSRQALEILTELQPFSGHYKFVFPSHHILNNKCLGENTLNMALRRLGYSKDVVSIHGFRATARTLLDEVLKQRVDLIEHQLCHAVKDANGRAYNRTSHLDERKVMMQVWADYLDELKQGAAVLPFRRAG